MYIVTEPLGPFVVYFFSAFHKNIVKIKRDRLVIRRLFTIHIRNQFSNNGISKTEGQRMSQVSANQKIYNSIQRKLYQVRAEFNGRTTQRYQYTVTESKIGSVWKYLTVNK